MWSVCTPAFSKKAPELHRQYQSHQCENLKELVYIPDILYHAVFTTLLICCQNYEGDSSHSAQLLWSITAVAFLIPVLFRQPVEHQGWPRTSPHSTAIMKTLVFRDPLAKWAKSGRNSCKALLNNEKTKKVSLHWLKGRPIAKLQHHCHHPPLWGHFQSSNAPPHVWSFGSEEKRWNTWENVPPCSQSWIRNNDVTQSDLERNSVHHRVITTIMCYLL